MFPPLPLNVPDSPRRTFVVVYDGETMATAMPIGLSSDPLIVAWVASAILPRLLRDGKSGRDDVA